MNISASLRFDRESGMVTMDADKNSVSIYNNLSNNRNSYSPNQMLLLAMGSCASADVLSILTKMHQDFTDFRLKLEGIRFDSDPMVLKSVDFKFDISGQMATEVDLVALRGITRVDFLWGEGELYLNEVNSIPGSLARYLWIDPERRFIELLDGMVSEALVGPAVAYGASGADGSVLEKASSMASKLA